MGRTADELLRELRREIHDRRVLDAIREIPRDRFVPPAYREAAWENRPLPIGAGQTISQPLIVAVMTEALALNATDRVLELGTGSGYQTAILARLAAEVVSVERYAELQQAAAERLAALGLTNVRLEPARTDELGFMDAAPYDAILVTAAAPQVPPHLIAQLGPGGRLVLPVGSLTDQELLLIKREQDRITRRGLGSCRFVPLIGPGAWPEGTMVPLSAL
ncbi:MAG: protein-L-isoaspartate(D-aspartate) O-methyltransferase [Dehalococcoidia bacterium]|nr:protein-L-isoaspartate(D-aspartate) O-methyltransferase [Dehalococcoidia bacterium]